MTSCLCLAMHGAFLFARLSSKELLWSNTETENKFPLPLCFDAFLQLLLPYTVIKKLL